MANVRKTARPLSPHLSIWKWGPGMTVSIMHRATGGAMSTVGTLILVWWLIALASGPAAYSMFLDVFTLESGKLNIIGYVVGIGITYAFFQHLASGVRHLFLDVGANFELKSNKVTALTTFVVGLIATVAFWAVIVEKNLG